MKTFVFAIYACGLCLLAGLGEAQEAQVEESACTNLYSGKIGGSSTVCCDPSCGSCDDSNSQCTGISGEGEGFVVDPVFASKCCPSKIKADNNICSPSQGAPCRLECDLYNGIPNYEDNVCCAATCGSCGGSGCSARLGGSSNCCGGTIASTDRKCIPFAVWSIIKKSHAPCVPKKYNGEPCSDGADCRSGRCVSNVCRDANWGKAENYGSCSSGNDCISGHCSSGLCVACTENSHCPSGRFCEAFSKKCINKRSNGVPCTSGSQCSSGRCCGLCCSNSLFG